MCVCVCARALGEDELVTSVGESGGLGTQGGERLCVPGEWLLLVLTRISSSIPHTWLRKMEGGGEVAIPLRALHASSLPKERVVPRHQHQGGGPDVGDVVGGAGVAVVGGGGEKHSIWGTVSCR